MEDEWIVRSVSKLDSAGPAGEPAMERRSPDPREREAVSAEDGCQSGWWSGSVVGDGRFTTARRMKQGDLPGARGWKIGTAHPPGRSQSTHSSDEAG